MSNYAEEIHIYTVPAVLSCDSAALSPDFAVLSPDSPVLSPDSAMRLLLPREVKC